MRRAGVAIVLVILSFGAAVAVSAQSYPNKPVHLIGRILPVERWTSCPARWRSS